MQSTAFQAIGLNRVVQDASNFRELGTVEKSERGAYTANVDAKLEVNVRGRAQGDHWVQVLSSPRCVRMPMAE